MSGSSLVPKDDKIPRKKACFADNDKESGELSKPTKKECDYCKKWKPHNKDSHFTNECRIYNAGGTLKPAETVISVGACAAIRSTTTPLIR